MVLRTRFRPVFYLACLVLFLAAGIAIRVVKGPLQDGKRVLGFEQEAAPPGIALSEEPACIEWGQVPRGATLSQVLEREGVPDQQARDILASLGAIFDVRRVRASDEYRLLLDRKGSLTRFELQPDESCFYVVSRDSAGLKAWRQEEAVGRVYRKLSGRVDGSLYMSMLQAGLRPALVASFCDVFSYDVDFATETRNGDSYELLVEQPMKDGQPIGPGRLLSGRYLNDGHAYEAFYFERPGRKGEYYRASGEALRRAFLKSPLSFTRVSSGFSYHRRHPIFGTVRPHLGVDYAAPTGTPVVSVADGVVQSAGWVNGYGRLVRIRHPNGVATSYAHLSRFGAGIRPGARVNQSQVIGYVGRSGNATGPHLDFRVEQGGRFTNPLRFRSPGGEPLAAVDRPAFDRTLTGYRETMAALMDGRSLPEADFAALMRGALAAAGESRPEAMAPATGSN